MGISPKEIYMEISLRGFNDLTQKMCKAKGLHKKLLKKKWGKYSLSLDVSLYCVSKEARELYDIVRSAIEAQSYFPLYGGDALHSLKRELKTTTHFIYGFVESTLQTTIALTRAKCLSTQRLQRLQVNLYCVE